MSISCRYVVTRTFKKTAIKKEIMNIYLIILLSFCFVSPIIGSEEQISNYEALDNPIWHDCGGSNWHPDSEVGHENVLKSGPIECTGISAICTNVTGPANISFWWRSDSINQMAGQLSFLVDDTRYVCDSTGWTPFSYQITDDQTYELIWEFRKIRCYPKNNVAGWISDLYIEYGDSTIPHGFKTSISETATLSSNITIVPASITILASEVTISPKNITMNPDEVTISPKNITMNPDEVTISPKNIIMIPDDIMMVYKNNMINPSTNIVTIFDNIGITNSNEVVIVDDSFPEDNSELHKWRTIEAGLNDAYNNGIYKLLIKNGDYPLNESIYVYKPIWMEGETKDGVNIYPCNTKVGIRISSDKCVVRNLSLNRFGLCMDVIHSNDLILSDNNFEGIDGIYIINSTNVWVMNSSFINCILPLLLKSSGNIVMDMNNVSGCCNGICILKSADVFISNNDLTDTQKKGILVNESSEINIVYNNLKSSNNGWIEIDNHKTVSIDCNWWKENNCTCGNAGYLCDTPCKVNCSDNYVLLDSHPYYIKYGWIVDK